MWFAFKTVVHGYIIGLANIIPGVSGGTMALVLGIYERLIAAINNIGIQTAVASAKSLRCRREEFSAFVAELKRIDAWFLALIGFGAVSAILSASHLMEYLLKDHHEPSYGFFFGLILVSVIIPFKYIKRRSYRELISGVVAMVLVVALSTGVSDTEKIDKAERKQAISAAKAEEEGAAEAESDGFVSFDVPSAGYLLLVFGAGAIAISAMILPGISGSFILLLLGVYFEILGAINDRQIFVLAAVGCGCLFGLLVFVRIMHWLLARFHNQTMAFMVGLMIGSLYSLWPFKDIHMVGEEAVYLGNILPSSIGSLELVTFGALVVGCIICGVFCFLDKTEESDSPQL